MPQHIAHNFFPQKNIISIEPWGNGHINDTYKLITEDGEFILQKINHAVFKNPKGLINNHFLLQNNIDFSNSTIEIPQLFPTKDNEFLHITDGGEYWRVLNFIKNSYPVEVLEKPEQALEAGKAFGIFAKLCSKLSPKDFTEAIPDFHSLVFRLSQLKEAIATNTAGRLNQVQNIVDFYVEREAKLLQIDSLIKSGDIPIRLVHNDTKINNLLFREEKAIAVIDLDTLGPGCLYYDFGDAIRTIANTSDEDEKELNKVGFNMQNFQSFASAYLTEVKEMLTPKEKQFFYLAPQLMTYIMGIRFLADYLNGDVYYKTAYAEHNIVRSRVQQKLIECMEDHQEAIISSIDKI